MSTVAPTILTDNAEEYKSRMEKYHEFAERIHIDISDGEFAPTLTLGPDQLYWPAETKADIHAMVMKPSQYVGPLLKLKPNLIIFHAEVEEDLLTTMQAVQSAGVAVGVALLRPTVPKTLQPIIELADHAMIFSGELGQYGGKASLMQLEKVRLIRMIKPGIEIGWDGGASAENAYSLSQGGVDVLNVGGALSRADNPAEVYEKMTTEINKQRVF